MAVQKIEITTLKHFLIECKTCENMIELIVEIASKLNADILPVQEQLTRKIKAQQEEINELKESYEADNLAGKITYENFDNYDYDRIFADQLLTCFELLQEHCKIVSQDEKLNQSKHKLFDNSKTVSTSEENTVESVSDNKP